MSSPHTKTPQSQNDKMHNSISKLLMVAALPAALLSQSAIAAPYDSAPTIKVYYQDLNLANKRDQIKLARRINSAVKKVCNGNQARTLSDRNFARQCQTKAMKKAYRQMEQLVAHHKMQIKLANNRIFIVGN